MSEIKDKVLKKRLYDQMYCLKNKEKIDIKNKNWYAQNRDLIIKKTKEYYAINKDKIREKARARYRKDPISNMKRSRRGFLKRNFNITPEEVDRIKERQKNLCKICKIKQAIHLDHNHRTNKIRGILCAKCNFGIGLFNDDIKILTKAIRYLKKHD